MPRRRPIDDEDEAWSRPRDRAPRGGWSTKLAWLVLFGGSALLVTRVGVATVVRIHGDGMAPTLLDGDQVVLLRSRMDIERGDVVVYDPMPPSAMPPEASLREEDDTPKAPSADGREFPDPREDPRSDLRNTAVIDREELEDNWKKVQARSEGVTAGLHTPLRVGRVVALPGDTVTFHLEGSTLGLAINGEPVRDKPGEPIRIRLQDTDHGSESSSIELRAVAYETHGKRRYPVLVPTSLWPAAWTHLQLPPRGSGPAEIMAEGYLVLADNRDGGACCDSRRLGWIHEDTIRGEVVMRLPGDPSATPDLDPSTRGVLWKP